MTKQCQQLYRSRSLANQFMVQTSGYDWSGEDEKNASGIQGDGIWNFLQSWHADTEPQEPFDAALLKRCEGVDQFGLLVIKPHCIAQKELDLDEKEVLEDMHLLFDRLKGLCEAHDGIWGALGSDRIGCMLPKQNALACQTLDEQIREFFKQRSNTTRSTGIAVFPTLNYRKVDILANACKALAHAEFYADGRGVVFDAVSLNISGDAFYQRGQIEEARDEYQHGLLLDPLNINLHNSLGVCYGIAGEFEKALACFETTAWLDSNEIMAVYNAGLIYMLGKQSDKALACFHQALEIGEDVFEVLLKTGILYVQRGESEKALTYLEKAVQSNPKPAYTYRYIGECYSTLGSIGKAIAAYKKAVKKNPNDADSLSALGVLFEKSGENKDIALIFCEQSVTIAPDNGLYRFRLGYLYNALERFEDAMAAFEAAEQYGYDTGDWIPLLEERITNKQTQVQRHPDDHSRISRMDEKHHVSECRSMPSSQVKRYSL